MSRDLKIIHIGLGPIGIGIAKMVLLKEGLKVVGACDSAPEKANKDLGDVLGLGKKLKIKVSGDPVKFIKTIKADLADIVGRPDMQALAVGSGCRRMQVKRPQGEGRPHRTKREAANE